MDAFVMHFLMTLPMLPSILLNAFKAYMHIDHKHIHAHICIDDPYFDDFRAKFTKNKVGEIFHVEIVNDLKIKLTLSPENTNL